MADSLAICDTCREQLPFNHHACLHCARQLPTHDIAYCGACLTQMSDVTKTFALFHYEQPITQALLRLKVQREAIYANVFARLLAAQLRERWYQADELPACIIAVPMDDRAIRRRGFNQALELARHTARILQIDFATNALNKIKQTHSQHELSASSRRRNLERAFECRRALPSHVALVDDVITTGSTVQSVAKCLKHSGVTRVDVWCCARTAKHRLF